MIHFFFANRRQKKVQKNDNLKINNTPQIPVNSEKVWVLGRGTNKNTPSKPNMELEHGPWKKRFILDESNHFFSRCRLDLFSRRVFFLTNTLSWTFKSSNEANSNNHHKCQLLSTCQPPWFHTTPPYFPHPPKKNTKRPPIFFKVAPPRGGRALCMSNTRSEGCRSCCCSITTPRYQGWPAFHFTYTVSVG